MTYAEFLQSKHRKVVSSGFEKPREHMNQHMFDRQKDIAYWELTKGRDALFGECGGGKSTQRLGWAESVSE